MSKITNGTSKNSMGPASLRARTTVATQWFAAWFVRRLEAHLALADSSGVNVAGTEISTGDDLFRVVEAIVLGLPGQPAGSRRSLRDALRDHVAPFRLARRHAARVMERCGRAWPLLVAPTIIAFMVLYASGPMPRQAAEFVRSAAFLVGLAAVPVTFAFSPPSRVLRGSATVTEVNAVHSLVVRAGWSPATIRTELDLQDSRAARIRRRVAQSQWGVAAAWGFGLFGFVKWGDRMQALQQVIAGAAPATAGQPGAARAVLAAAWPGLLTDLLVLTVVLLAAAIAYAFVESHSEDAEHVLVVVQAALAAADRDNGRNTST